MTYARRVKLITPLVYLVGILGYIPAWFWICFRTRSYTPILLGGSFWWCGITLAVEVAGELAKEADINGN